jgi:hypothetical protein
MPWIDAVNSERDKGGHVVDCLVMVKCNGPYLSNATSCDHKLFVARMGPIQSLALSLRRVSGHCGCTTTYEFRYKSTRDPTTLSYPDPLFKVIILTY